MAALKRLGRAAGETAEATTAVLELVLTLLPLLLTVFLLLLLLKAVRLRLSLRSRVAAAGVLGGSVVVSAGLTRKSLNRVLLRVVVVVTVASS